MGQILDNGYEMKTTFWSDFTIADAFGTQAVRDTFNNAFNSWKNNVEYITELVLVLNWKCWYWYDREEYIKSKLYSDLFYEADDWCMDNLKGKDLSYYLDTTD